MRISISMNVSSLVITVSISAIVTVLVQALGLQSVFSIRFGIVVIMNVIKMVGMLIIKSDE